MTCIFFKEILAENHYEVLMLLSYPKALFELVDKQIFCTLTYTILRPGLELMQPNFTNSKHDCNFVKDFASSGASQVFALQ